MAVVHEELVANQIYSIQGHIRSLEEDLNRGSRSTFSQKLLELVNESVRQAHEDMAQTETTFRNWTVYLASEPVERQKKKIIYERLNRQFQAEVNKLNSLSRQVSLASQEDARKASLSVPPLTGSSSTANGGAYAGSHVGLSSHEGDNYDVSMQSVVDDGFIVSEEEEDAEQLLHQSLIFHSIAQERTSGIKRIQGQVRQVNEIVRDLATMIVDQDATIRTIETATDYAATHSGAAYGELKKAYDRKIASNRNTCHCVGVLLLLLLMVIIFYFVRPISHTKFNFLDLNHLTS
eukprot:Filipodium_phascolosomae@DN8584_c0_g1_i1.p1